MAGDSGRLTLLNHNLGTMGIIPGEVTYYPESGVWMLDWATHCQGTTLSVTAGDVDDGKGMRLYSLYRREHDERHPRRVAAFRTVTALAQALRARALAWAS